MKKNALIFAVCLAVLGTHGAMADDNGAARAATRRATSASSGGGSVTNTNSSRQKSSKPATGASVASRGAAGLSNATQSGVGIASRTATTTISPRDGNVISESARQTIGTTVGARQTASEVSVRPTGVSRTAVSTSSRTPALQLRSGASSSMRSATPSRGNFTSLRATSAARAADSNTTNTAALREKILNRDYSNCRTVYYDCMDEFCANKDSQLKRCACSARLHDFDKVKKRLDQVEEKMLDFSERLLTVNMDKEDAAALFTATEGENAFNSIKDKSDSQKILDQIAKKLKISSSDDSFNEGLQSISLSLNIDSAFDSVDLLQGVNTTSKEGAALYNAALPVCRQMAAEVCDEEALNLAISGYQMAIEQDCNTVSKSYSSQADQAREKVRESSALLDMSRLDIYQKRNSDDILTCKKKMLTQLSDTSVCGTNLAKCLDMTGHYIDPSTGQAFLTEDLSNLANLITRPTGDATWLSLPGNSTFAQYLRSKKKYLEPATENCQDIADDVWEIFLEDALAQIKLAQENKLEEVRQSCTTLTTQCLSNAAKSLSDFDARALSTFGVTADKTVNAMCDSIKSSCSALMNTTSDGMTLDEDWVGGMTQIATDKTYDTILQTCREVGRACIIQVCRSTSGNFGLCENIDTSVNRKSVINRTACWIDVLKCVQSADSDSISRIFGPNTKANFDRGQHGQVLRGGSFYNELYGTNIKICPSDENDDRQCVYDICQDDCNDLSTDKGLYKCRTCRLAEKIWGNCEFAPQQLITNKGDHNRILKPQSANSDTSAEQTLLWWFATNTGTYDKDDNCRDTTCAAGFVPYRIKGTSQYICMSADTVTVDGKQCTDSNYKINLTSNEANCCGEDHNYTLKLGGNCCMTNSTTRLQTAPISFRQTSNESEPTPIHAGEDICNLFGNTNAVAVFYGPKTLVCQGTLDIYKQDDETIFKCSGKYVYVTNDGQYIDPQGKASYMYYNRGGESDTYNDPGTDTWPGDFTPSHWKIGPKEQQE